MDELILEAGRADGHYWRDLWRFRVLFAFLAWQDFIVRLKQTVFGVLWAVVRPIHYHGGFLPRGKPALAGPALCDHRARRPAPLATLRDFFGKQRQRLGEQWLADHDDLYSPADPAGEHGHLGSGRFRAQSRATGPGDVLVSIPPLESHLSAGVRSVGGRRRGWPRSARHVAQCELPRLSRFDTVRDAFWALCFSGRLPRVADRIATRILCQAGLFAQPDGGGDRRLSLVHRCGTGTPSGRPLYFGRRDWLLPLARHSRVAQHRQRIC